MHKREEQIFLHADNKNDWFGIDITAKKLHNMYLFKSNKKVLFTNVGKLCHTYVQLLILISCMRYKHQKYRLPETDCSDSRR